MLIEMHAHTSKHSSCSRIDPVELVERVRMKGLQGLVITEHDYLWSDSELQELRREAGIEETFLLLAAQEVSTSIGHVLVYGADHTISGASSLRELRKLYPGAALVWAHPFRNDRVPKTSRLLRPELDAIEIITNNHSSRGNYLGLTLWHRHRFTAISGSDTHAVETAGTLPTLFDHPVRSMDELVGELKKGRCRPLYKEIPKTGSNAHVEVISLGTKGEDESRQRIIVKRPKGEDRWKPLKRSSEILRLIHDHGFSSGPFRVPAVMDINDEDRYVIEEGQRGKSLFELIGRVGAGVGRGYIEAAAQWLARLHTAGIDLDLFDRTLGRERHRFESYLRAFEKTGSPYLDRARVLLEAVSDFEEGLFSHRRSEFVVVHGDYHPKNIIIGQGMMQDIGTLYVSVVDFGSVLEFHPAFDVGYFLAQFESQLRDYPDAIERYPVEDFIQAYLSASKRPDSPSFRRATEFFQIRANLSIASFLIHMGKGTSANMEEVMARSLSILEKI
jgi:aminoglycoside phosphotransferase (APT) family kinase protein